jgi:hypothetical protein
VRYPLLLLTLVVLSVLALESSVGQPGSVQAQDGETPGSPRILGCNFPLGDDGFEENDTFGTAASVALPFSNTTLVECSDEDWFSFFLNAKTTVHINAFFTDADGDIDISLYNPSNSSVASSTSTDDDEEIEYTTPAPGVYRLRVRTFSPPLFYKGNDYDLTITACQDDPFENNDNIPGASPISIPFDESGLQSCPSDSDYISFTVAAGKTINVDAFFADVDGDIDMQLFRSDLQVAISQSLDDDEHITYLATIGGTYRVRVYLFGGTPAVGNDYRLRISTEQPSTPTPTQTPTQTPPATSTPTGTPTQTPEKPIGDVNDDGSIDPIDAALVLQYVAGLLGALPNSASADTDQNGTINAIDAALILQYSAGLVDTLPP